MGHLCDTSTYKHSRTGFEHGDFMSDFIFHENKNPPSSFSSGTKNCLVIHMNTGARGLQPPLFCSV